MAANIEDTIQEKVRSLSPEKQQQVLSLVEEMLLEKSARQGRGDERPIWEIAEEISLQVSLEEWKKLPADGAEQHDHYLYGSPKK